MIIVTVIVEIKLLCEDVSLRGSEEDAAATSQTGSTWANALRPDQRPALFCTHSHSHWTRPSQCKHFCAEFALCFCSWHSTPLTPSYSHTPTLTIGLTDTLYMCSYLSSFNCFTLINTLITCHPVYPFCFLSWPRNQVMTNVFVCDSKEFLFQPSLCHLHTQQTAPAAQTQTQSS